jgi:hypothetical protein
MKRSTPEPDSAAAQQLQLQQQQQQQQLAAAMAALSAPQGLSSPAGGQQLASRAGSGPLQALGLVQLQAGGASPAPCSSMAAMAAAAAAGGLACLEQSPIKRVASFSRTPPLAGPPEGVQALLQRQGHAASAVGGLLGYDGCPLGAGEGAALQGSSPPAAMNLQSLVEMLPRGSSQLGTAASTPTSTGAPPLPQQSPPPQQQQPHPPPAPPPQPQPMPSPPPVSRGRRNQRAQTHRRQVTRVASAPSLMPPGLRGRQGFAQPMEVESSGSGDGSMPSVAEAATAAPGSGLSSMASIPEADGGVHAELGDLAMHAACGQPLQQQQQQQPWCSSDASCSTSASAATSGQLLLQQLQASQHQHQHHHQQQVVMQAMLAAAAAVGMEGPSPSAGSALTGMLHAAALGGGGGSGQLLVSQGSGGAVAADVHMAAAGQLGGCGDGLHRAMQSFGSTDSLTAMTTAASTASRQGSIGEDMVGAARPAAGAGSAQATTWQAQEQQLQQSTAGQQLLAALQRSASQQHLQQQQQALLQQYEAQQQALLLQQYCLQQQAQAQVQAAQQQAQAQQAQAQLYCSLQQAQQPPPQQLSVLVPPSSPAPARQLRHSPSRLAHASSAFQGQ